MTVDVLPVLSKLTQPNRLFDVASITRVPSVVVHDEIDLFAMMQSIWKQKTRITAIVPLVGAIASVYGFWSMPHYEVSKVLRPAALELDTLNRSEVYSLPPGKALVLVGGAIGVLLVIFRHLSKMLRRHSLHVHPGVALQLIDLDRQPTSASS